MPFHGILKRLANNWSHRLALRLQLWVLLAGLPSLALGALLVALLYDNAIVLAERSAAVSARQAMDTLDRLVFERYSDTDLFSSLPAVRTLDRESLQHIVNLCVSSYAPYYALAAVSNRDGAVIAIADADGSRMAHGANDLQRISAVREPWFAQALANSNQVIVYDAARDVLAATLGSPSERTIILARAIKGVSGEPVGVWSSHLRIDSMRPVLQQPASLAQTSYPMVLRNGEGDTLLAIGVPGSAPPAAVVTSSGFARWSGKQWTLAVYRPALVIQQQRLIIGLAGLAIAWLTAASTIGLAWIFRRELLRPLAELECQVMWPETQRLRPCLRVVRPPLPEPKGALYDAVLHRDDELGKIARLLTAQTADMRRYLHQLIVLNESSRTINEHVVSLPALLEQVLHTAKHVTGARYAALAVLDDAGERIVQFLTEGMDEATKRSINTLPTGRGLLGTVMRKERVLRLADLTQHPESIGFPPHHPPMRSFLGTSIRAHGKLFGRIYLTEKQHPDDGATKEAPDGFTEFDEQLISALAYQAGTAIEIANLIEEIRRTQSRDRALLDSVEEGIYGLSPSGTCLFINRAGAQLLGYEPSELIGQPVRGLIHHTAEDGTSLSEADCRIPNAMRAKTACRLDHELLW